MNIKFIAIPAIAIAGFGLAACGTTPTIIVKAAPAVTHTVTAPAATPKPSATTAPPKATPAPAKTVNVQAPAPPAQHAATRSTYCGEGLTAGAGTSCEFAADVERAYHAGGYWNQPGTSYFTVDGQFMTSASVGNPVIVTDGSGDLVQFND